MEKMDTVYRLREARRAHVRWVSRARGLINGLGLDKDAVPMMPTDCVFGEWYYGDGQALSSLPAFRKIEAPHNELHDLYMQIFKLLFTEKHYSFLEKLFGVSHKQQDDEKLLEAKRLLMHLDDISKTIVQFIEELEEQVLTLTDVDYRSFVEARA